MNPHTLRKLFTSKAAIILASLVVAYLLLAYFAVNPLAKRLVPWIAESQLASTATVAEVRFDPLRLTTTIRDFKLTQKNGAPLASVAKLVVDFEVSGLLDWAWKFKDISMTQPQAHIAIDAQGKLNWSDLIAKLNEDPTPPSDSIARVVIEHIALIKGHLSYSDANRPQLFKAELTPLDLALDGFSTLPKDRGNYLIAAHFPEQGGSLKWKGSVGVNPLVSKGEMAIEQIQLAKLMRIVKGNTLPFQASGGDIQASFAYDFALVQDKPKLQLKQLALGVNNVAGELAGSGALTLNNAALTAAQLDLTVEKQTKLQLDTVAFKLEDLKLQQGSEQLQQGTETSLRLQQSSATLPTLAMTLDDSSQLQFDDLNITFNSLGINKGQQALLTLPQLDVQQVAYNLAEQRASIAHILLPSGIVNVSRDAKGAINWAQAFASPKSKASNDSKAFSASNQSQPTEPTPEPSLARTDAAPASAEPTATASTAPNSAHPFQLSIGDIQLQHWRVHYQDQTFVQPLQLKVANINVGFALEMPDGNVHVKQLSSTATGISAHSGNGTQPVATLRSITLKQGSLQLDKRSIDAESLILAGLNTALIQDSQALNWQTILQPVASAPQPSKRKAPANQQENDWAVGLKKLALTDSRLQIEDRRLAAPLRLTIEQAKLELQNPSLNLARAVPLNAVFNIKQGGQLNLQGKLTPSPLKADLSVKLAGLSLKPFAPYINQVALLTLNDGKTDVAGQLSLQQGQALALAFKGGFSVNQLSILEEASSTPFLGWERVSSNSLQVSLAPNRVHMAELQMVKPVGKLIIHEDKSMNITRILRNQANAQAPLAAAPQTATSPDPAKPDAAKPAPTPAGTSTQLQNANISQPAVVATQPTAPAQVAAAKPAAFPVSIDSVRIDQAQLEFADLSLTPQFGTYINSLSGVINGVSTDVNAVAQLELDGKVDDYGSAKIRGSLQPFNATAFTDVSLSFKNLEMNRLTPYSGKFAGRRIDAGKLSVDLEYKIKQRQLAGQNKFIINKLKLGDKIDSADAADLPLDLAIAILEDSDGLIDLDLPIAGSLDDPQFSYGSIVWKAIRNVLTKIVTSPFRALGKLFGSDAEKLEAIVFEPGSAGLMPPEQEKLNIISQALSKRQTLNLGIVPAYDSAADTRALQETAIRRQVANEMGIKLEAGQQPGPIDLQNKQAQSAIDDLYNTLTKKSLLKKLADKLEKPKAGHYEEALEKLTTSIVISEPDLQALAKARAEAIQQALVAAGIAARRVHIDAAVKSGVVDNSIPTKLTLDVKGDAGKTPASTNPESTNPDASKPAAKEPAAATPKQSTPAKPS